MSLADISAGKTVEADQILGLLIAICAGAILGLELYRKRPMEAAGKAMAFKRPWHPSVSLLSLQLVWEPPCFLDFTEPSALGTLWNGCWHPFSPLHY